MGGFLFMIEKKDVIRMRIPYPNINSDLAKNAHMYICLENHPKKFLKCQTSNRHALSKKNPPYQFVKADANINHTPFKRATLIDCDKSFVVNKDIIINEDLLTTRRRDISGKLFDQLKEKINHNDFREVVLDAKTVMQLNSGIKLAEQIVSKAVI